jgi:N-acetylglucosaminyl-diphospho-decaprenol L-rhamnosyltransferase
MRNRVDVIVVTHQSRLDLERCLESIVAATRRAGAQVLVADNASTDGTIDLIRTSGLQDVSLLELGRNGGYAFAVNAAVRHSDAEFLVVLNPDIRADDPDALARLVEHLRAHPAASAVAPQLLDPDGTAQASARVVPTLPMLLARQTNLDATRWGRRTAARYLALPGHGSTHIRIEWALGAALAFRRADYDAVGGWDERFFLYFEDVDFCVRLAARGREIHYLPSVRLLHDHRRESDRRRGSALRSRARREHIKSAMRFFSKHPRQAFLATRPRRD